MNEAALLDAPVVETPEPEPSLRDTIEQAVVQQEGQDGQAGTATIQTQQKPVSGTEPAAKDSAQPAKTGDQPAQANTTKALAGKPAELKAPSQWKPQVREHWTKIPLEAQQEILRREADSMKLIGTVGTKIKFADDVGRHIAPFMERLKTNNVPAAEFIGDIFSSVQGLASNDPKTKAEIVANIVQSYGVDLKTLDSILTQRIQQPPEVAQARRDSARAQAVIAERGRSEVEAQQQQVGSAIAKFAADPKHEFIADVRFMMADLIDTRQVNSLEEAYTSAIWANPDTRKILLQREAEQRVAGKQQRATAARLVSSSVDGGPRGQGAVATKSNANSSLRDDIGAAIDALSD